MDYLAFFDKHQWLPTIITIPVTVAVTVTVAIWQIKLQLKNTLKSQRANKLDELHTEIYKEIAEKIEDCELALIKTSGTARIIPSSFEIKISMDIIARSHGLAESHHTITERFPKICEEHSDATDKLAKVLFIMDKYEIVFSDFSNMKMFIRLASQEFSNAASDFHHYILRFLPRDIKEEDQPKFGGAKVIAEAFPDQEAISQIRALSESVTNLSMDLAAYLHDLRIEAQNVLLSPIFEGKKAPARVPGDPRYPVLTLDTPNNRNQRGRP
jgi:hypothetical protein